MYSKSSSFYESQRKLISRIFAGLLFCIATVAVPVGYTGKIHEFMELLGFILLIVAALGRIWCSIYISGRKNRVLCTDGPYSICRNPLYFFSFIGVLGFFIALQSIIIGLITASLYLLYYHNVILSEETRLEYAFGDQFKSYTKRTPRFIPSFSKISSLEQLTISPRIIERSLREVVWFLLAIAFVEIIEMIHEQGYLIYLNLPF